MLNVRSNVTEVGYGDIDVTIQERLSYLLDA